VEEGIIRLIDGLRIQLLSALHPYGLCDAFADLKQLKSVSRSLRLRRRMLLLVRACFERSLKSWRLTFLARMAIHMGLEGAGARKALIAYFALVLFLRA